MPIEICAYRTYAICSHMLARRIARATYAARLAVFSGDPPDASKDIDTDPRACYIGLVIRQT
jgi:hypothetical protein